MYEFPTELKISSSEVKKVTTSKINKIKFCLFQKSFLVNAKIIEKREIKTAKKSKYTLYIICSLLSFLFADFPISSPWSMLTEPTLCAKIQIRNLLHRCYTSSFYGISPYPNSLIRVGKEFFLSKRVGFWVGS